MKRESDVLQIIYRNEEPYKRLRQVVLLYAKLFNCHVTVFRKDSDVIESTVNNEDDVLYIRRAYEQYSGRLYYPKRLGYDRWYEQDNCVICLEAKEKMAALAAEDISMLVMLFNAYADAYCVSDGYMRDDVTGIYGRTQFFKKVSEGDYVAIYNLGGLNAYNEEHGFDKGDTAMKDLVEYLMKEYVTGVYAISGNILVVCQNVAGDIRDVCVDADEICSHWKHESGLGLKAYCFQYKGSASYATAERRIKTVTPGNASMEVLNDKGSYMQVEVMEGGVKKVYEGIEAYAYMGNY